MAIRFQLRRGNTAENDAFTGALGELTLDTQRKVIRFHDGVTRGGIELGAPSLVAVQRPTASNNYTWYRKYSDGWVEQGGSVVVNSASVSAGIYSSTNITFPIALQATRAWHCQAKHDRFNAGFANDTVTTGASVYQVNDSSASFANPFVIWEVKGYAAA